MDQTNLSPAELSRYTRQIVLPGWGREAQERLKSSRVFIAGAGGVASAAAHYLIAAGLGGIRLADQSRVSLADLNHQPLYRDQDLDKPRAVVAESRLKEVNPFAVVESRVKPISGHNITRLTAGCQLLIDTMHQPDGHLLNLAAARRRIPLLHARVWEMNGHLTTFWPGQGPCLACDSTSLPGEDRWDRKAGIMGPLPGILGSLLALEAMQILGGFRPSLLGRLLTFQGSQFRLSEKEIKANPQCSICCRPLKT
jgi:adenylyltransferase/sulfurtransferase